MSGFQCYALMGEIKDNGGWSHVGDGQGNKELVITKGDKTIHLNEDEIKELIERLSFFDPRLY